MKQESEKEMRESEAANPKTLEELSGIITDLIAREHNYGTCVYAMSLAAVATFNYVARELGVTGFQASCADMDILRRTRSLKGPFMIINGEDMLYPQYDLPKSLQEAMHEWRPWVATLAKEQLAKADQKTVHPDVLAHWHALATSDQPSK